MQTINFYHQRYVAWFPIVQQYIYITYVIFFRFIKMILHLILSHFSPYLIICFPLLIHINPIGQSGKLVRSTWTILYRIIGLCGRSIHLVMACANGRRWVLGLVLISSPLQYVYIGGIRDPLLLWCSQLARWLAF